ncbi:MAG: ribosome small subunit-dependent GTPase A [Clostridia bacterium]|nr:ribosome small subunit-dependent GTPase A [Clostridia bacterium]
MIISAIIIKSVGGLFTIRTDEEYKGEREFDVRAKGSFKHERITLLAGDRVEVEIDEHGEFYISRILTRTNSLIRPPLANLDLIFIVISCKKPAPVYETIDKMISIAEFNKIEPVIVITKADLDPSFASEAYDIYSRAGFKTMITSSESGQGCTEVREYIEAMSQKTPIVCAFSGASGAGKSTIINKIFPTLRLETGDLSRKIERGKNTTRTTELFPLEKLLGEGYMGYLADTPGFSLLDFERFDFFFLEELKDTFREFGETEGRCRYTKCTHTKEEGCSIIERVKLGEIPKSRHDSYISLYNILKTKPKWKR